MSRLIVISNRAPSSDQSANSGGLVFALSDTLRETDGIWIGTSGETPETVSDEFTERHGLPYRVMTFDLSQQEHDDYYLGYSNSVLWPTFHGRVDLIDVQQGYFEAYEAVNRRLARMLAEVIQPDDIIWVHDYHFIPLAGMLREAGFENRIGFFLHIPVPTGHNFQAIPENRQIAEWFSAYDLVGLQSQRDISSFVDMLDASGHSYTFDTGRITAFGRTFRVAKFPIGIDPQSFAETAVTSESEFRQPPEKVQIIGVDRLDYSKGLPQRFRAFQTYLRNYQDMHERISLLQIAPPTREDVEAYREIRQETEALTGEINGEFSDLHWTPIRFIHRAVARDRLAGLYRQSKVGLVTPLVDGMNLVAKEYIAAQNPDDPGVLVLSRFAGAAEQMHSALLVNPHDPYDVAEKIDAAVHMPLDERQHRYRVLFDSLTNTDLSWWSRNFLDVLMEQDRLTVHTDRVPNTAPKTMFPDPAGLPESASAA
jgi:trehalose 6-phosphate synthase